MCNTLSVDIARRRVQRSNNGNNKKLTILKNNYYNHSFRRNKKNNDREFLNGSQGCGESTRREGHSFGETLQYWILICIINKTKNIYYAVPLPPRRGQVAAIVVWILFAGPFIDDFKQCCTTDWFDLPQENKIQWSRSYYSLFAVFLPALWPTHAIIITVAGYGCAWSAYTQIRMWMYHNYICS